MNDTVQKPRRERGSGGLIRKEGSPFWYAAWRQNGKQYSESTGTDVKQKALAILRDRLRDAGLDRTPEPELKKMTYEDLRASFIQQLQTHQAKSLRTNKKGEVYLTNLPPLDRFFAGWKIKMITPDTIRRFVRQEQEAKKSSASINRSLAALRRMFRLAAKDKKLSLSAVPNIELLPEPPARKGFLELPEFRRLYGALPDYLKAPAKLAYHTGMRRGEIERITWPQVDFLDRILRLEETKNGEDRNVPLNSELFTMFTQLKLNLKNPANGPVFGYLGQFRAACKRAGLAGLLFHDFRRSGIRNFIRAGVSEQVAMRISGHKTTSVFRRYNIVSTTDLHEAAKKQDAFIAASDARVCEFGKINPIDASLMQVQKSTAVTH